MGIEKLRTTLLSEAEKEAQSIVQIAQNQANTLIEEARTRDAPLTAEAEKEITRLLNEQRGEKTAWARLEAKRIHAEAQEDAIRDSLEDFFEAIVALKKGPEYRRFMKESTAKAVLELDSEVIIHICDGEKDMIPKIKGAKVVEDLDALGGAIVESTNGKLRINLTLDSLFDSKRDELRKQVYQKLFGGK